LKEFDVNVDVYDPWAVADEVKHEYGVGLIDTPDLRAYDGIVLAVAHNEFKSMITSENIDDNTVVYDVKSFLPREIISARL
jgi:UDP-N-acetyl-D-galactosamine dehydrogenase